MNRQEVMEIFNKRPRIGTLSTVNKKGEVNVAVFGSPQMIDENTVVMGIGRNRSFRNLQEVIIACQSLLFVFQAFPENVADVMFLRLEQRTYLQ